MRGANCDSDHFPIRTIIRHKISCTYQKKQKYKIRLDTNKLENNDKKKYYQLDVTGKLKKIERKQDVNEEWINIKKCHHRNSQGRNWRTEERKKSRLV